MCDLYSSGNSSNGSSGGGTSSLSTAVSESIESVGAATIPLISESIFLSQEHGNNSSAVPSVLTEPLKIELLKIVTVLVDYCPTQLVDSRKDIIRFSWTHLKADDVMTKHWAYVMVCCFIKNYETPPKIILQVYVSLLKDYSPEFKDLVRTALDYLVPSLQNRLKGECEKAMKWTKKIIFEEGHTLPLQAHVWGVIVRHSVLFYAYRSHFVPQMVSSLLKLGIPQNCPTEHRHVALCCAEVLIGWEWVRLMKTRRRSRSRSRSHSDPSSDLFGDGSNPFQQSADLYLSDAAIIMDVESSNSGLSESSLLLNSVSKLVDKDDEFSMHVTMSQLIGNFLVRLGMFLADSREKAHFQLTTHCVDLFRKLLIVVPMKNMKISYFERLIQTFIDNYNMNSKQSKGLGQSQNPGWPGNVNEPGNAASQAAAATQAQQGGKGGVLAVGISDRILCTFLYFLNVSVELGVNYCSLFLQNVSFVKDLLVPLLNNDNQKLQSVFRKFIIKVSFLFLCVIVMV